MKIECTIKRQGGTQTTIGKTKYHFKPESPDEDAPHVAEVTDEAHAARFLSIKEAYRGVGKAAEALQKKVDEDLAQKGSGTAGHMNAPDDMDEDVVSEETIVEILEALDELIAERMAEAKAKRPSLETFTINELTNKDITAFFAEQTGENPKNKSEINKYAKGCGVTIRTDATQPAAMLRDLFAQLAEKFPPTEEGEGDKKDSDESGTE